MKCAAVYLNESHENVLLPFYSQLFQKKFKALMAFPDNYVPGIYIFLAFEYGEYHAIIL